MRLPLNAAQIRAVLVGLLASAVVLTFVVPFIAPVGHAWIYEPAPATRDVVTLYWVMFWIGIVVLAIVQGGIIASIILFRERPGHVAKQFHGHTGLEFLWTIIPAIIVIALSIGSFQGLSTITDTREYDMTVEVTGVQWAWQFRYPDQEGLTVSRTLHIPTNTRVRLVLTSTDVIHSFWVPALSGKMDAVPGRTTEIWLLAPEPGEFNGQCAEFCGLAHADMLATVVAEPMADFQAWVVEERERQEAGGELERLGRQVAQQTCVACHSFQEGVPSTLRAAPNLARYASEGPFAAEVRRLRDTDESWLRLWVEDAPSIKPGIPMPRFEGVLTPEQIEAVVFYLMTLE